MEGSDNQRAFKCVERGAGWLRLDGLDTTHLKKNSRDFYIHSEAIKGTQLRWHGKSLILKNFAGNFTSRNGKLHGKVQLLLSVSFLVKVSLFTIFLSSLQES